MKKYKIPKDLIKRFLGNLKEKKYIKKRDKILISCSGEVDSAVMLDLLCRIKEKYALKLKIIHFNHSLRGKESKQESDSRMKWWRGARFGLFIHW